MFVPSLGAQGWAFTFELLFLCSKVLMGVGPPRFWQFWNLGSLTYPSSSKPLSSWFLGCCSRSLGWSLPQILSFKTH